MRPKSIIMFEKLFLTSTVLGLVSLFVNYGTLREFALANGTSPGAQFAAGLGSCLWNLVMWFFIARRASNIAKWIFVVLLALNLVFAVIGVEWYVNLGVTYALSVGLLTALEIIAATYLFRRDAVTWLRSRGKHGKIDSQIFE